MHLDEITNDALHPTTEIATRSELDEELARVQQVISSLTLTGADLSYWFKRLEILGEVR